MTVYSLLSHRTPILQSCEISMQLILVKVFFFCKIKTNGAHVGAFIQTTRTEKTVSKSFPFSCSEPPPVLCKRNESEISEFRRP